MKFLYTLWFLLLASVANAQTLGTMIDHTKMPEIERQLELTKIQRNQFLDEFNKAAVKIDTMTEELTKANALIKELEAKVEPKPEEKK